MTNRRPPPARSEWLDVPAAARYATVRHTQITKAIAARALPAVTTHPDQPGVWMIRREDVEQWLSRASAPRSWSLDGDYVGSRLRSMAMHPTAWRADADEHEASATLGKVEATGR